jgi:transmembrane sensor
MGGRTPEPPASKPGSIDDTLATSARRLRAVDPHTHSEWQRLQRALAENEDTDAAPVQTAERRILRPAIALAVALAVLVATSVLWLSRPSVNTYETAKGEHATVILPDSTQVILNHTSVLTVTRGLFEKTRHVNLKGEAYFDVRRNGTPFVVSTDLGTVTVLGTEFNVRDREGRMEVGVLRGSVRVTRSGNGADSGVVLTNDQIIACTKVSFAGKVVEIPSTDYPGWMHGKLVLYRSDLLSAVRELESELDIVIRIQEQRLGRETITGTIDVRNVGTALETFARLTGTHYRHENGAYILY